MTTNMSDLSVNPMVEALLPDPNGARRVALVGFVGPSGADGRVRLYADMSFATYYEFDTSAVVSSLPVKPQDENSPTMVIVDRDAKVEKVTVTRTSGDASFVSGGITGSHFRAAQSIAGGSQDPNCACVAFSVIANTLAGGTGMPDCACVFTSVIGSTLAGANALGCCNPTYTAGDCTRQGPSMVAPAAPLDCLQITLTAVCTPTGMPYICPAS